jgi:N-methylhydantoinase B/oxoprolinase/acetone carboxylase alpha subunit
VTLDPVDVKIVWDRLVSAVNAASRADQFSAFSTAVTEAKDFGCTLLNARGELVATSDFGLPSFCLMTPVGVQALIGEGILSDVYPDQVWVCNDPWRAAAQTNDLLVVKPIFRGPRLEGYAASVAHNPDIGGVREWFKTTDVYEEGLLIPPLPLIDRGERTRRCGASSPPTRAFRNRPSATSRHRSSRPQRSRARRSTSSANTATSRSPPGRTRSSAGRSD